MLVRWMLPFPYIRRPTVLYVRNIVYEDPDKLFSLFKHEFICPDVRALNATIFVHSTPKTNICKGFCVWRLQMSCLAFLNRTSYVLMLERWMLSFSYMYRPTVLMVRNSVHEDDKWVFLADLSTSSYVLMLERWMLPLSYIQRPTTLLVWSIMCEDCPYVRALNATTLVRSTPNNSIGKDHYVWRLQMSYLADLSTSP